MPFPLLPPHFLHYSHCVVGAAGASWQLLHKTWQLTDLHHTMDMPPPTVRPSTTLEPDVHIFKRRYLDSWLSVYLTPSQNWGIYSCAMRLLFLLSCRSSLEGGLHPYASEELREKKGFGFGNALLPPCVAALHSYWWLDRNTSVFAANP